MSHLRYIQESNFVQVICKELGVPCDYSLVVFELPKDGYSHFGFRAVLTNTKTGKRSFSEERFNVDPTIPVRPEVLRRLKVFIERVIRQDIGLLSLLDLNLDYLTMEVCAKLGLSKFKYTAMLEEENSDLDFTRFTLRVFSTDSFVKQRNFQLTNKMLSDKDVIPSLQNAIELFLRQTILEDNL